MINSLYPIVKNSHRVVNTYILLPWRYLYTSVTQFCFSPETSKKLFLKEISNWSQKQTKRLHALRNQTNTKNSIQLQLENSFSVEISAQNYLLKLENGLVFSNYFLVSVLCLHIKSQVPQDHLWLVFLTFHLEH